MNEHYNQEIARHYSADRPPLHPMILSYVLSKRRIFLISLDVGCGTGDSAIALAKYCEHVYGIEPSAAMFKEVMPHKQIKLLVAATELAHILLSSSNWYKEFADKYGVSNPFALLANDLERKREQYDLYVIIYYSKHQITIE